MKPLSVVEIIFVNVVLLSLLYFAQQDLAWRLDYWSTIGFRPQTHYSIFSYVVTGSRRDVAIPGLLSIDWSQILIVLLLIIDITFIVASLPSGKKASSLRAVQTQ